MNSFDAVGIPKGIGYINKTMYPVHYLIRERLTAVTDIGNAYIYSLDGTASTTVING